MIKPGNTHQISSLRFILVPAAAKICLLSLLHVVPFVELFISTSFINQTLEKLLAVSPTFKFQTLIKIDFLFSVVYTVSSNNFLIMFVKFGPKSLPLSFVYVMGVPLSTSFIQKGRCTEETSFQFPILSLNCHLKEEGLFCFIFHSWLDTSFLTCFRQFAALGSLRYSHRTGPGIAGGWCSRVNWGWWSLPGPPCQLPAHPAMGLRHHLTSQGRANTCWDDVIWPHAKPPCLLIHLETD